MRLAIGVSALWVGCRAVDETPAVALPPPEDRLADIDPFIGTGGQLAQVTGVSPGAAAPLGLTLVGPDTRSAAGAPTFLHLGGYHYDDDRISGFAHTRGHGLGIHDFGGVHVMPRERWEPAFTGAAARAARFSHDDESASPGRYSVELEGGVGVTIVATPHGAHHRYTFPVGAEPVLILDLGHAQGTVVVGDAWAEAAGADVDVFQRLEGGYSSRFGGLLHHAALRVDPPPSGVGGWDDPAVPSDDRARVGGPTSGLYLRFPEGTTEVDLRVGLSMVDLDGAWRNLDAELPDRDIDARLGEVEAQWRSYIDRVQWSGGSAADDRMFATALYHTLLMPRRYDDVDGRYRGLDGDVHTTEEPYLSDMSLWDTFRTVHPWYTLVWPELQVDVLRSLGRMVEDGGELPRWPMAHGYTGGMIGTPAAMVLAESHAKQVTGWDEAGLWTAAVRAATEPIAFAGRDGLDAYQQLGFVAADLSAGAASKTLEYAWADAALVGWGERAGRDVSALVAGAGAWENTFDPQTGFFRGRAADGSFPPLEDPHAWTSDFVEGNAWHYRWCVPWDVEGLVRVQYGGDTAAFIDALDAYWSEVEAEPDDLLPDSWYWHGNEPVLHYAALGSLAGDRDTSVRAFRWVAETRYDDTPEGLDGNDDAGTLSAWLLWQSLGVYPVAGTDQYAVGAPRFRELRIRRDDGDVVVRGPGGDAAGALFIDGERVDGAVIDHEQLLRGLSFE